MRTSSIVAVFLCLLAMAAAGLILLPAKPAANPASLINNNTIKADSPLKNDSNAIPQGTPGLEKEVKVDLSLQKAFLYENGDFVREYQVSSGKPGMETPTGRFRIVNKSPKIFSQIAKCWISFWACFTPDGLYGFHETPVCNGQREGEDMIGQPASSGCLRLKKGDAQAFYNWIDINTSIDIYGRAS